MSIVNFFDSPPDANRQRIVKEAIPITMWKCPDDGTNLHTREATGSTIRCTHCGQELSIVAVKYAGQVR
jgi:hypothetical protein